MHILLLKATPLHGQKCKKGQELSKLTIRNLLQDYAVIYITIILNKY